MDETDALKRFKQDLLLAGKTSYKSILRIDDMGEVGGVPFISMAFVDGQDLCGILRDSPKLRLQQILKFLTQLA